MPEWLFNLIGLSVTGLLILWAALSVIAIKGLLFHQPEQLPELPPPTPEELEMINNLPRMPLGCIVFFAFFIWPLLLASWISSMAHKPDNR